MKDKIKSRLDSVMISDYLVMENGVTSHMEFESPRTLREATYFALSFEAVNANAKVSLVEDGQSFGHGTGMLEKVFKELERENRNLRRRRELLTLAKLEQENRELKSRYENLLSDVSITRNKRTVKG